MVLNLLMSIILLFLYGNLSAVFVILSASLTAKTTTLIPAINIKITNTLFKIEYT